MKNKQKKTFWKSVWAAVQWIGRKLAWIYTVIFLALIYLIVVGPMCLAVKLFRKDPLQRNIDPAATTFWQKRISSESTLERQKYQF
jgi:hypothetical protein